MAIISPTGVLKLRNAKWRLLRPGQRVRSEWTGRSQGVILPGAARWAVSGEFPPIARPEQANPWIAFFAKLNGQANSFWVYAVEKAQTGVADPTVNGAGQVGNSLNITGTANLAAGARATIPLADGSYQLVVLTAALAVTGAGSMAFEPPLRSAALNGQPVRLDMPFAIVSLTSPEIGWDVSPGQIYGFTIDAEESF